MTKLYSDVGDIKDTLQTLHTDPASTAAGEFCYISGSSLVITGIFFQKAHKIEELLTLEAKYGPLPGHTPAVDYVISYLKQVYNHNTITTFAPELPE